MRKVGSLNQHEFVVAMLLVLRREQGLPLPDTLPLVWRTPHIMFIMICIYTPIYIYIYIYILGLAHSSYHVYNDMHIYAYMYVCMYVYIYIYIYIYI